MNYTIPVDYLDKLQKKINRIKNKGGNITFNVGAKKKQGIYLYHKDPSTGIEHKDDFITYIDVVDVEVEGKYIIDGWEFIATIEHKENGNIIRAINNDYTIPDKYYTCGPACEHCHIIRDRKDTYLVYNKDKNDWKQVGKTCLHDYTGLDAETCAQFADLDSWLENMSNPANYKDDDGFSWNTSNAFEGDLVKTIGYALIKKYGYIKQNTPTDKTSTIAQFQHDYKKDEYQSNVIPASKENIEAIDKWVDEKQASISNNLSMNEYMNNAIIAWKEKYPEYRDLGLIFSLINYYFKDIQEKKANLQPTTTSNYVGNIGDRIEFKVKSYRFLYTKSNDFGYNNTVSTSVYQVNDDKGNVLIVETSNQEIDDSWIGKTISAKVKAQKEYKGVKQTVVNRIKLLNESLSVEEAIKQLE
jgi:hypothetical protein